LPALNIYRQLGFEDLFTIAELVLKGKPDLPSAGVTGGYVLRESRPQDWQAEYELAVVATAAAERWLRGIEPTKFRRGFGQLLAEWLKDLFSGGLTRRYCLECDGGIAATMTLHVRARRWESRLSFHVHPDHRGQVEDLLLGQGLVPYVEKSGEQLFCEHPASHEEGILALRRYGFSEIRRLLTMRKAL